MANRIIFLYYFFLLVGNIKAFLQCFFNAMQWLPLNVRKTQRTNCLACNIHICNRCHGYLRYALWKCTWWPNLTPKIKLLQLKWFWNLILKCSTIISKESLMNLIFIMHRFPLYKPVDRLLGRSHAGWFVKWHLFRRTYGMLTGI